MPFQNRVTPFGELVATAERGSLTGNRGVLHDERGRVVRPYQSRRWITCLLSFRDRHRIVMTPHRYTHLFFLDEATALSAGHRPCAECRNDEYQRFRRCWAAAHTMTVAPGADAMDVQLHQERRIDRGSRQTHAQQAGDLPDGVVVVWDQGAWLVSAGQLLRWTPGGYTTRRSIPGGMVAVLTPPTTVAVLRAGFRPGLHPSATT